MLNLDPNLLDQDKIRFKKRKKFLLVSIIPVVVLVFLALFLVRTGLYNIFLSVEVKSKTFTVTPALNDFQAIGNIIEPYIKYYNSGYIKLINASSRDNLIEAENDFRESLKNNPPESMLCTIYGNLSYSIELQAKDDMDKKDYDSAITNFNRAEGILYKEGCAEKDSSGKKGSDEKSENSKYRIIDERRKAVAAANDVSDDSGDGTTNNQQISEEKLQQIKESQKKVEENGGSMLRYKQSFGNGASYTGSYTPRF